MGHTRWTVALPMAALLSISLLARTAAAQDSSGPMTVQRVGSSVFIAPDFKLTDFDGKAVGLAGAYGGYLAENMFFIGAGGYGLTDASSERDMWYFGLVTGIYVNRDRAVGYAFKTLIGGGEATIAEQYDAPRPQRPGPGAPVLVTSYYSTGIFVFEPEANVIVHMNKHLTLSGGVGYRLTGDPYWGYYGYDLSTSRFNGVTGTVSLQIGTGL
jgi:hypothetical protein